MLPFTTTEIIVRIAIALGLGAIIGLERTFAGKGAGMRTYSMVALGASIFIIISEIVLARFSDPALANPLLVASAIITGIGFIGAGLVIFQNNKITGLTTAAGLWVAAGVGMASGFGFTTLALIGTIAALTVFVIFWFIERGLLKLSHPRGAEFDNDNAIKNK